MTRRRFLCSLKDGIPGDAAFMRARRGRMPLLAIDAGAGGMIPPIIGHGHSRAPRLLLPRGSISLRMLGQKFESILSRGVEISFLGRAQATITRLLS